MYGTLRGLGWTVTTTSSPTSSPEWQLPVAWFADREGACCGRIDSRGWKRPVCASEELFLELYTEEKILIFIDQLLHSKHTLQHFQRRQKNRFTFSDPLITTSPGKWCLWHRKLTTIRLTEGMQECWTAMTSVTLWGETSSRKNGQATATLLCFAAVCRARPRLATRASVRAVH